MAESWVRETCDKCGAANWLSLGDPNDLTQADAEVFKCWLCGNKQIFEGLEDHGGEPYCEDGRWSPDFSYDAARYSIPQDVVLALTFLAMYHDGDKEWQLPAIEHEITSGLVMDKPMDLVADVEKLLVKAEMGAANVPFFRAHKRAREVVRTYINCIKKAKG